MADYKSSLPIYTREEVGNTDHILIAGYNAGGSTPVVNIKVDSSGVVYVRGDNIDIRDLVAGTGTGKDNILIFANTVKDGSGTNYVPLVDADGQLQVDVLSMPAITVDNIYVDDASFTVAVSKVGAIGALANETSPDSVNEGDIGIPRMTLDRKMLIRIVGASDANRLDIDGSGHAQVDIAAISVTAFPVSKDTSLNSETNPIFVKVVDIALGNEKHDYDTTVGVAKDATDNHIYLVSSGKKLLLRKISASASGAMKIEVQVGPAASLVTKLVMFSSQATPNMEMEFTQPIEIQEAGGSEQVRIIRTNRERVAMDVYSTIMGTEV